MNPNDPKVKGTLEVFGDVDPSFKQLFGSSDGELADIAAMALPPEPEIKIETSGELINPAERAQTDGRLAFSQIFGDSPENVCLTESLSPEGKQMAGLTATQKAISPELQRAAEKFADKFLSKFITNISSGGSAAKSAGRELRKTARRAPISIEPALFKKRLAELAAEDPDADPCLVSFLRANADGDEETMRRSAKLFAAELA